MDLAFQLFSYAVWLPLEFLTISAIFQRGVRRYPLPFAYVVVCFLTAVAELPGVLTRYVTHQKQSQSAVVWFWIDEGIRDLLVLMVVISFLYVASSKLASQRIVRFALVVFGFLFAGGSFLVHFDPQVRNPGFWMTPWTRD